MADKRTIIVLAIASLVACGGGDWEGDQIPPSPVVEPDFSSATGKGVHIAIIDTGVRKGHRDFTGHISEAVSFLPTLTEAQALYGDCAPYGGHGTSVASIAAGRTWGIAPDATIHPLIAVSCMGWSEVTAVVSAIDTVIASPLRPVVINLSFGGRDKPLLDEAVTRAVAAGIVVIVSAGNDAQDACLFSPARVLEAITVGATDLAGNAASFSNFGPCVDFYLPGVERMVASSIADNGIGTGTGTSFSAPHAAGWAAKVLEVLPKATPAEVFVQLQAVYAAR